MKMRWTSWHILTSAIFRWTGPWWWCWWCWPEKRVVWWSRCCCCCNFMRLTLRLLKGRMWKELDLWKLEIPVILRVVAPFAISTKIVFVISAIWTLKSVWLNSSNLQHQKIIIGRSSGIKLIKFTSRHEEIFQVQV